jgi:type IV pilus assembly protein PilE
MKSQSGFTLIEILIVVTIFTILAAIAVPAYTNYRMRANRSEARTSLLEAAQNLERYFVRENTYATATVGTIAGGDTVEQNSPHRLYQLSWQGAPTQTSYTLRAVAQGSQAGDSACATMTVNQLGVKTPAACW